MALGGRDPIIVRVAIIGGAWSTAYLLASIAVSQYASAAMVLSDLVYPLLEIATCGALAYAAVKGGGRQRWFFALMAASTGLGVCADTVWALFDMVFHRSPIPSLADALYLASLAVVIPAVVAGFGSTLRLGRSLLDASIIVLALGYGAVEFVVAPLLGRGLTSASLVVTSEGAMSIVAGLAAVMVLAVRAQVPRSFRLLAISLVVQSASWIAYDYLVISGRLTQADLVYAGWQVAWAMMSVAAAMAVRRPEPYDAKPVGRNRDVNLPVIVAGAGVVLLVATMRSISGRLDPLSLAIVVVAMTLVIVRLALVSRERHLLATRLQAALAEEERVAATDPLTGVPNRRTFDRAFEGAINSSHGSEDRIGLLLIDIDNFKDINDDYGHHVGDQVLRHAAARLKGAIRDSDLLARIGGDEFIILISAPTPNGLRTAARRCIFAFHEPVFERGVAVSLSVSIGGALLPDHATSADELVRIADEAMYGAKGLGKNCVAIGPTDAPQRTVPIPDRDLIPFLEMLADRVDNAQSDQEHSMAMLEITRRLAASLGLTLDQRRRCLAAARLHDIGKVGVPSSILTKPGPLTDAERQRMCEHAQIGATLLEAFPQTAEIAPIVAQHHERVDGRGYPHRRHGDQISIEARIVQVADVWTAMLADRPYRSSLTIDQARHQLLANRGSQFDPQVVDALLGLLDIVHPLTDARPTVTA